MPLARVSAVLGSIAARKEGALAEGGRADSTALCNRSKAESSTRCPRRVGAWLASAATGVAEALDLVQGGAYHDPVIARRSRRQNLGMIGPNHQRIFDGLVLSDGQGNRRALTWRASVPCPTQIEGAPLPPLNRTVISASDAPPKHSIVAIEAHLNETVTLRTEPVAAACSARPCFPNVRAGARSLLRRPLRRRDQGPVRVSARSPSGPMAWAQIGHPHAGAWLARRCAGNLDDAWRTLDADAHAQAAFPMQQRLNFSPLPHGHGAFRPGASCRRAVRGGRGEQRRHRLCQARAPDGQVVRARDAVAGRAATIERGDDPRQAS